MNKREIDFTNIINTGYTLFGDSNLLHLILQFLSKKQVLQQSKLHTVSKAWRAAASLLLRTPLTPDTPLVILEKEKVEDVPKADEITTPHAEALCDDFLPAMFGTAGFTHRTAVLGYAALPLARYGSQLETLICPTYFERDMNAIVDLRHLQHLRELRLYNVVYYPSPDTFFSLLLPPTVERVHLFNSSFEVEEALAIYRMLTSSSFPSLIEFTIDVDSFGGCWRRETCDTPWEEGITNIWKSAHLRSVDLRRCWPFGSSVGEREQVIATAIPNLKELYFYGDVDNWEDVFSRMNPRIEKLQLPLAASARIAQMLEKGDLPMLNELILPSASTSVIECGITDYLRSLTSVINLASRRNIKLSLPSNLCDYETAICPHGRAAIPLMVLETLTKGKDWAHAHINVVNKIIELIQPIIANGFQHRISNRSDYLLALHCSKVQSIAVYDEADVTTEEIDELLLRYQRSLREYEDYREDELPTNVTKLPFLRQLAAPYQFIKRLPEEQQFSNVEVLTVVVETLDHLLMLLDTIHVRFPALQELRIGIAAFAKLIAKYITTKYRRQKIDSIAPIISQECAVANLRITAESIVMCYLTSTKAPKQGQIGYVRGILHREIISTLTALYGTPIRVFDLDESEYCVGYFDLNGNNDKYPDEDSEEEEEFYWQLSC